MRNHRRHTTATVAVCLVAVVLLATSCDEAVVDAVSEQWKGVSPTAPLRPSGSITVRDPGTVVEHVDVAGMIDVRADHVTIRQSRITATTGQYGIRVRDGVKHLTVESVDINAGDSKSCISAGIYGGTHITVRNSEIRGCADGIKAMSHSTYEGNHIEMWKNPGSDKHVDGIQGSGRTSFRVVGNTILVPAATGGNSAVFVQSFNGSDDYPVRDVIVEGNYLSGGNYTVYSYGDPGGAMIVRDNRFGRTHRYGIHRSKGSVSFTGNRWGDTGAFL